MKKSVYFDYAASTPVDEDVLTAMLPYFSFEFGNPSSIHLYGQAAEAAIENARVICSEILETQPKNIIFTSGGTESDNLALRGIAIQRRKLTGADEIIISSVEHHAVSHTAIQLQEEFGFKVVFLPVDGNGMVDPDDVSKRITTKTALVSVIYANNEVGTINPIIEIGRICQSGEIPFHSDAVQAAAHLPMSLAKDNISLISIGAHKMYGPKGIGLLGIKSGIDILSIQTGGGQENHLRAGTENVPLIVGLTEAFKKSQTNTESRENELSEMRDQLISGVLEKIPSSKLTGHPTNRLPNHASFVFAGVDGNRLLMVLDGMGFACSSGSACKVGSPSPSDVLLAMGYKPELALGSLRVTLGKMNSPQNIQSFVSALVIAIGKIQR
ncbi:MAG: cysteine desulfurase family protein [Leptolinea sp.]